MTISAMQWPDSASVALIERVMALATNDGPAGYYLSDGDTLRSDTTSGTLATGEAWTVIDQRPADPSRSSEPVRWETALLLRPGEGCASACRAWHLTDTGSVVARENWRRVRDLALAANGVTPSQSLRDSDLVVLPKGSSPAYVTVAVYRAAHLDWAWPG
jgi:hypothetical protein